MLQGYFVNSLEKRNRVNEGENIEGGKHMFNRVVLSVIILSVIAFCLS